MSTYILYNYSYEQPYRTNKKIKNMSMTLKEKLMVEQHLFIMRKQYNFLLKNISDFVTL